MPERRLQRTRDAYRKGVDQCRPVDLPHGDFSCFGYSRVVSERELDSGFTANVIEGEYDTATDPGDEAA